MVTCKTIKNIWFHRVVLFNFIYFQLLAKIDTYETLWNARLSNISFIIPLSYEFPIAKSLFPYFSIPCSAPILIKFIAQFATSPASLNPIFWSEKKMTTTIKRKRSCWLGQREWKKNKKLKPSRWLQIAQSSALVWFLRCCPYGLQFKVFFGNSPVKNMHWHLKNK